MPTRDRRSAPVGHRALGELKRLRAQVAVQAGQIRDLAAENERLTTANLALRENQFDPDGDYVSQAFEWRTCAEQLARERDDAARASAALRQRIARLTHKGGRARPVV